MKKISKKSFPFLISGIFLLFQKIQIASAEIYLPTSAETGLSDKPLLDIVIKLTQNILVIFGLISIICFVIAAIYYLTSSGDEEVAKRGKRAMLYCITGVVLGLGSFVVIKAIDAILKGASF